METAEYTGTQRKKKVRAADREVERQSIQTVEQVIVAGTDMNEHMYFEMQPIGIGKLDLGWTIGENNKQLGEITIQLYDFFSGKSAVCGSFELQEDFQRTDKHYGTRIWQERVEKRLIALGYNRIKIEHVMEDARSFWEKLGYQPVDDTPYSPLTKELQPVVSKDK